MELRKEGGLRWRRDELETEAQERPKVFRWAESGGQVMKGKVSWAVEILKKRHTG